MKAEKFPYVVSRLRPRLLALARQYDADEAEDAVQEAMMRLWRAWEGLPDETSAERLSVRLTKHACIDAFRQRQRMSEAELKDVMMPSTEDALQEREGREALEEAVAALPPAERRVWTLFTEAQMDRGQVSAATGIAVRSVSTMLSAARRHIVETLRKRGML